MLKQLTPEKLEAIKTQIFSSANESSTDKKNEESHEAMDTENSERVIGIKQEKLDNPKLQIKEAVSMPVRVDAKISESQDDDCIYVSDSDEENASATVKAAITKPDKPAEEFAPSDLSSDSTTANTKRKFDEKIGKHKSVKRTKECINPECPEESTDFIECHLFILNFFFVAKKPNRVQYVCSTCFDKAILKYEEMCEALLNDKPLISIPIHKKHDMIEVIDSDDEHEPDDIPSIPDSEKIRFNCEDEKLAEEVLKSICSKIDIRKQLKLEQDDFKKRCDAIDEEHVKLQHNLRVMDKKSSRMYNDLYSINKPRTHSLPPLNIPDVELHKPPMKILSSNAAVQAAVASLQRNQSVVLHRAGPPTNLYAGQKVVIFPPKNAPELSQAYFANRFPNSIRMQSWSPCQKLETFASTKMYKVKFLEGANEIAVVKGKDFASNQINYTLQIGARVVAQLRESPSNKQAKFFPGVIGEKLSNYNNHRYLVFCDYGQVQYVKPEDVREVVEMSVNVWDDVHPNLRAFIRDYLMSQTQRQRALLNVRKNQFVPTERNSVFRNAQVLEIDCSIMKMFFVNEGVYEWLYRGSKRLQPIFNQESNRSVSMNARRVNPNISYTTIDDEEPQQAAASSSEAPELSRNIAKKSTSGKQQHSSPPVQSLTQTAVKILNDTQIYLDEPKKVTKCKHFTPKASIKPLKYETHECSPSCLPPQTNSLAIYSPLSKPLLTCWERQIVRQKSTKMVMYKAPCGRRLRDMFEIRTYLLTTKCFLNVDNFDFNPEIQVLLAYDVIDRAICPLYIPDMTEGKEGMKIPVINAFDDQPPPKLKYSNARIPMPGVSINTDPAFMACCDCTDDCADKTKCACFQLTIQGYKFANRGIDFDEGEVSYRWKRLSMQVPTGIYECHSGCHCSNRCLNKVVQMPIQIKMQLYRTKDRGWGLECNHDIPKGTFICIYAGRLYREDDANALATGTDHGDEYYAELDIIETASQTKEGYEAGVEYGSDSDEEKASDSDSDYDNSRDNDTSFVTSASRHTGRSIATRSTGGGSKNPSQRDKNSSESDSDGDQIVSMEPHVGKAPTGRISLRRLYGKNEKPYVMDARTVGNVGRYFNVSRNYLVGDRELKSFSS